MRSSFLRCGLGITPSVIAYRLQIIIVPMEGQAPLRLKEMGAGVTMDNWKCVEVFWVS